MSIPSVSECRNLLQRATMLHDRSTASSIDRVAEAGPRRHINTAHSAESFTVSGLPRGIDVDLVVVYPSISRQARPPQPPTGTSQVEQQVDAVGASRPPVFSFRPVSTGILRFERERDPVARPAPHSSPSSFRLHVGADDRSRFASRARTPRFDDSPRMFGQQRPSQELARSIRLSNQCPVHTSFAPRLAVEPE